MNNTTPTKQIILTTIIAVALSLINFGKFFNQIEPLWVLIFFSYFLINYNLQYEFFIALFIGIILDASISNTIGQNAFALILASYFIIYNKQSIKIANTTTIMIFIAIASFVYLAGILVVHILIQGLDLDYYILLSPVTTALCYPFITYPLSSVRKKYF